MSPENYKPLVAERRRKDELLRCQIAQRDAAELTFQPKINSRKSRAAISNRRTSATERQRVDSANKSTRVDVQSERSVSAVEGLAESNQTQSENDELHPIEIGGKESDGCHERLYQLGLNRLSRLDEVHQVSLNNCQHLYLLYVIILWISLIRQPSLLHLSLNLSLCCYTSCSSVVYSCLDSCLSPFLLYRTRTIATLLSSQLSRPPHMLRVNGCTETVFWSWAPLCQQLKQTSMQCTRHHR